MKTIYVGQKEFGSKVDITDPCYDKNVKCRINDIEIKPGLYNCYVNLYSDKETNGWGERVASLEIIHLGLTATSFKLIGSIGVDAGLAGIFQNKPDYTDEEWYDFCKRINVGKYWIINEGFFSSTGYGDGYYPVFAGGLNGEIIGLKINYMEH